MNAQNRRRDEKYGPPVPGADDATTDMTDRENIHFRCELLHTDTLDSIVTDFYERCVLIGATIFPAILHPSAFSTLLP